MSVLTQRPGFTTGMRFMTDRPLPSLESLRKKPSASSEDMFKSANLFRRPAFQTKQPAARKPLGLSETESLLTRQQGIKIRLGDETLKKFFEVSVPVRGPDGQPLRGADGRIVMEKKVLNIGALGKSLEQNFRDLTDVVEGKAQEIEGVVVREAVELRRLTGQQRDDLAADLTIIIGQLIDAKTLSEFTTANMTSLVKAVKALSISKNPVLSGLPIVDGQFLTPQDFALPGVPVQLMMYLIANIPSIPEQTIAMERTGRENFLTPFRPVIGVQGEPILVASINANFTTGGNVLDLQSFQFSPDLRTAKFNANPQVPGGTMSQQESEAAAAQIFSSAFDPVEGEQEFLRTSESGLPILRSARDPPEGSQFEERKLSEVEERRLAETRRRTEELLQQTGSRLTQLGESGAIGMRREPGRTIFDVPQPGAPLRSRRRGSAPLLAGLPSASILQLGLQGSTEGQP
jgi:hypothetical protein